MMSIKKRGLILFGFILIPVFFAYAQNTRVNLSESDICSGQREITNQLSRDAQEKVKIASEYVFKRITTNNSSQNLQRLATSELAKHFKNLSELQNQILTIYLLCEVKTKLESDDLRLLALQDQIQRCNRAIQLLSQVMKGRHDTAKEAISNIRN